MQRFRGPAITAQAERAAINPAGEGQRCGVADGPRRADKIRHAAREERLRKTRRHRRVPLVDSFRCDAGFARVRENETRDPVDPVELVRAQHASIRKYPAGARRIVRIEKAMTGVMKDIKAMIDQLIEHRYPRRFAGTEKFEDLDVAARLPAE